MVLVRLVSHGLCLQSLQRAGQTSVTHSYDESVSGFICEILKTTEGH